MTAAQLMNTRIRLEPPSMGLWRQNLEAVRESEHELRLFLDWVDHALTEEETIQNIRDAIDQFESFTTELRYSIVRQSDERFLGMIGLLIGDPATPTYEIGYWLRSSETGKGYMRDAVSLLEHHVFTQLGAEQIEIRTEPANHSSRTVAERSGYILVSHLSADRQRPSGEWEDTLVYLKTRGQAGY
ncbi:MAG: GNAT family N-acetyltransferase [Gammaproteobacteria bacterium]|nr:GNAT family N-acetyltransferase [Gammaproteobacteria bacterium]